MSLNALPGIGGFLTLANSGPAGNGNRLNALPGIGGFLTYNAPKHMCLLP